MKTSMVNKITSVNNFFDLLTLHCNITRLAIITCRTTIKLKTLKQVCGNVCVCVCVCVGGGADSAKEAKFNIFGRFKLINKGFKTIYASRSHIK